jgi:hypothetical protein
MANKIFLFVQGEAAVMFNNNNKLSALRVGDSFGES